MKIQKFWERMVDEAFKLGVPYVVAVSLMLILIGVIIGLIIVSVLALLSKFVRGEVLVTTILGGAVVYLGYCGVTVIRNVLKDKDGKI